MFVIIILLSLCYILYFLWCKYRKSWKNAPSSIPLKMYLIGLKRKDLWYKLQLVFDFVHKNGGVRYCYFYDRGIRGLYAVTDPEDALTALKACAEKDYVYEFWLPWIGPASFIGSAQVNRLHRKFYSKSFMPSNMEIFIKYFNEHSNRFVVKLSSFIDKGPLEIDCLLRMYNLEVLCDTMLAIDEPERVNFDKYLDAVSTYVRTLASRFENFFMQHDFIFDRTKMRKIRDLAIEDLHHFSNEMIRQRRRKLKEIQEKKCDPPEHTLLIDSVLEAADKGIITEAAMKAEIDGLIFAAHDTSAHTLLYTLVLLGSYPQVQDRIFEEIQTVLGERTIVTKDDISKMAYTEAVIKESMRIYPFVTFLTRKLDKDIALKNCTLVSGGTVAVSAWHVHRHDSWGPDANVFRPERWLEPDKLPKPTVLLGFSEGARTCIGRRYALLSMKVLLVHLIRNFRFKADCTQLQFKFTGVLEPIAGHHVAIEKRI